MELRAATRLIAADDRDDFIVKHGLDIVNDYDDVPRPRFKKVVQEIDKSMSRLQSQFGVGRGMCHKINVLPGKSFRTNSGILAGGDYNTDGYMRLCAGQKFGHSPVLKPGGWAVAGIYLDDSVRHELAHANRERILNLAKYPTGALQLLASCFAEAKKAGPIKSQISEYAAANWDEYFAEAFAAYTHPLFESSKIVITPQLLAVFKLLG